jgi:hypothetical protein
MPTSLSESTEERSAATSEHNAESADPLPLLDEALLGGVLLDEPHAPTRQHVAASSPHRANLGIATLPANDPLSMNTLYLQNYLK